MVFLVNKTLMQTRQPHSAGCCSASSIHPLALRGSSWTGAALSSCRPRPTTSRLASPEPDPQLDTAATVEELLPPPTGGASTKLNGGTDEVPLVDDKEAARLLGLSVNTMRIWRYQGKGPEYIKLGKAVRYHTAALARPPGSGDTRASQRALDFLESRSSVASDRSARAHTQPATQRR